MKQTLWEKLTAKPVELQYYNPLKAHIGSTIDIDLSDYSGKIFTVQEIHEIKRVINDKEFLTADYVIAEGDTELRIRINPLEKPKQGLAWNTVLLTPYDDLDYDEGLHNVCKTYKKFEVDDHDSGEKSDYWRIDDPSFWCPTHNSERRDEPGTCLRCNKDMVLSVSEESADVTCVNENAQHDVVASTIKVFHWDFSRMTPDDAGSEYEQFLFVEMNADNGHFQLWRGSEIDPRRVSLI